MISPAQLKFSPCYRLQLYEERVQCKYDESFPVCKNEVFNKTERFQVLQLTTILALYKWGSSRREEVSQCKQEVLSLEYK